VRDDLENPHTLFKLRRGRGCASEYSLEDGRSRLVVVIREMSSGFELSSSAVNGAASSAIIATEAASDCDGIAI
jgi:hypothetical protein